MGTPYAAGKRALGICDRSGMTFLLTELKEQIIDGRKSGLLVCEAYLDKDHPQLQLGRYPFNDPQALRDPRPDSGLTASRGLFSWNPVGWPGLSSGVIAQGVLGSVTVTTP